MIPTDPNRHGVPIRLDGIRWQVIDDGVMGGLSRGRWRLQDGALEFRGELSTANGGGFSSVRGLLPEPWEMHRLAALRLRMEGDGREYQLRLRDSDASQAIAFRATFRATADPADVVLPVEHFQPVIRGRAVEVLPALSQRTIRYIGFMLNTETPGPFRVNIRSLALEFRETRIG